MGGDVLERNVISEINNGLQTAFLNRNTDSNLAYRPQFITNDHKRGIKVLTHIENQLMHCDEFSISVAFISRSGFVELSETLKELERRGIKGRILTTDYLHFSDPYALDRLAELKNVELKMYHVDDDGVGFHTKGYLFRKTGIDISYIPRNLITVIFYYQISLHPLKTLSLSQVSFPLDFPLCYIFPYGFTNSDKGKYKGKKIL